MAMVDKHRTEAPKTDAPKRGRLTPSARANLATIVVESDQQTGRSTPRWVKDLAATRRRS